MWNNQTSFNIIIPQNKDNSEISTERKKQLLKDLTSITSADINKLWEAIDQVETIRKKREIYSNKQDVDNDERCSEERTLFIREYILRLWMSLAKRDPIGYVKWKPIFLWILWNKIQIYHDYDCIWKYFDDIYSLQDDENGGDKYVFSYDWVPVLAWRKDGKEIIIYGDKEIEVNGEYHESISETIVQIINYKIKENIHKKEMQ